MDFTLEDLRKAFEIAFADRPETRKITLQTGTGGMELIDEAFEKEFGYERIYVKKAPRFLKLRTSVYTGRKYKRYGGNSTLGKAEKDDSSRLGYRFTRATPRLPELAVNDGDGWRIWEK